MIITRKLYIKIILLVIFSVFWVLLISVLDSRSAGAVSSEFPDRNDFSQGTSVKAVAALANGTSYLLDAPNNTVRLYVPDSVNSVSLNIIGAGHAGAGDTGGAQTDFYAFALAADESTYGGFMYDFTSPASSASIPRTLSLAGIPTSSKYPGYRVVQLVAQITGLNSGWNAFRYNTSAGYISYFANPGYDKFALKADAGANRGTFSLKFGASCNVPVNNPSRLRFFDADAGQSNQGTNPVQTFLDGSNRFIYDNPPGPGSPNQRPIPDSPGNNGGGNSEAGFFPETLSGYPAKYNWVWGGSPIISQGIDDGNGIQFGLPFDGFGDFYRCSPPPAPSGSCTAYSPQVASNATVNVGDPVDVNVFVTNNSTSIPPTPPTVFGSASYLVYLYYGTAPSAGGAYMQKLSPTADTGVSFPTAHGPINQGVSSTAVSAGSADTSTPTVPGVPRTYTYTVNKLDSFTGGVANWTQLDSCPFSINVVQPYIPTGQITNAGCFGIEFNVAWSPPRAVDLTGFLRVSGGGATADVPFTLPNGGGKTVTFSEIPATIPIHLPSYSVILYVNNDSGIPTWADSLDFVGNCVSITCSPNPVDYEFGSPSPQTLNYTVTNQTNRTDGAYDVALSSPPSGVIPGPLTAGGRVFSNLPPVLPPFFPANNTTVVGTLRHNGVPQSFPAPSGCAITIQRFPYVKAYGADVAAGGGFVNSATDPSPGTCPVTSAGIFARMRPLNQHVAPPGTNKSGSGSQLGAFAWSPSAISGFATATSRTVAPTANVGNGLAFAGSVVVNPNSNVAIVGGNLSGQPPCIPNYFENTKYDNPGPRTVNGASNIITGTEANDKQIFYANSALARVVSVTGNYSGKRTYYVDGDVQINSNVIYDAYTTIATIPNFTLVVKGNIYIAPGVSQLDGVYIAQPRNNLGNPINGGYIYTCSNGTSPPLLDAAAVYASCSGGYNPGPNGGPVSKLVFNGAVIAKKVVLNRAVNTLNDSSFRELASASNAAEIFNFSPELFLAPPLFRPTSTPTDGGYNSIAVLPPIL